MLVNKEDRITYGDSFWPSYPQHTWKKDQEIAYCNIFQLDEFFTIAKTFSKYILISNNSDWTVTQNKTRYFATQDALSSPSFSFQLPPNLIRWYSCNLDIGHDNRIIPMPFGIYKEVNNLIDSMDFSQIRNNLLYINYSTYTSPRRKQIKPFFETLKYATIQWPPPSGTPKDIYHQHTIGYLNSLMTHKFIVSPRGNSIDATRTWEAIYCGCIPILEKTPFADQWQDLPISIIERYELLTEDWLKTEYDRIQNTQFNLDKVKKSYYLQLIENDKKLLQI